MAGDDQVLAKHRAAAAKVVDRIAQDSAYRQQLLENPAEALQTLLGLGMVPEEEATHLAALSLGNKCGTAKTCDQTCGKHSCSHTTCYYSCAYTSKVVEGSLS